VKEALPHLEKAHEIDPKNYEAGIKLLRVNNSLGQDYLDRTDDLEKAEFYFRRNIEIAESLARDHPQNAEAWFAIAIAYGNLALYSPAKEKVRLAQNVEKYLKKSIQLDPKYPYSYLGLAIFYREVSRITFIERFFADLLFGEIPQADLEEAESYFKKAIALDPSFSFARFHYAKCLEYMGRTDESVVQYDLVLHLAKRDFGDDILKKRAKDRIEDLSPGFFRAAAQKAERNSE
jgi:tetratricopeptide (TPR) repeat protein